MTSKKEVFLIHVVVASFLVVLAESAGLYGLGPEVPQLLQINPTTGQTTPVGNANLPKELTSQQLSSIDATKRIYYMVAFNETNRRTQLIGLSLTTGQLAATITLPFAPESFVGVGQTCNVIPSNGDVLVSGRDGVRKLHQILRVTPSTGHTELIASVGGIDVLGGASGFDPANNIVWLQLGTNAGQIFLYGFNINTKQQVFKLNDVLNMETLNYDPVTKLMWGVGLKVVSETESYRILMTLDSKSGQFNTIGKIPGYYIIISGIAAINPTARDLYCFLQKTGSQNNPFLLLTLDMKDASVKSSPVGCTNPGNCPWSMAYLP